MELFILIHFMAAELALAILSCTKWREKSKFLRNRALVTGTESVILLLAVLVPTTHMKWRFICAMIVIGARSLFALMRFLIKRKTALGNIKIPARIICAVLAVTMHATAFLPTLIFTNYNGLKTSGAYEIKQCSAILIDSSRQDDFEADGSDREVPVHFYYPDTEGTFPLVVFSHGAFGYYQSNYSTYAELASNGYVVVALDHPHHAFFTNDTDAKTVIVDMEFIKNAVDFSNGNMDEEKAFALSQQWMKLRTEDTSFVLDTIQQAKANNCLSDSWFTDHQTEICNVLSMTNTDKIGLIGHSMGGATAVALGRKRTDIDAVIDLDATMLSEIQSIKNGKCTYNDAPYPIPLLDFRQESDYDDMDQLAPDSYIYGFTDVNNNTIAHATTGKTVIAKNAGHMNFTDLPMFSPFLSSLLGTGDVDGEEFMYTVNKVVLNWFDYYLKEEGSLNIQATY